MLNARRVVIVLEVIIGILAVAGGSALLVNPTGKLLGFHVTMMHHVFESFAIPGALLVAMGLLHFTAAWATQRRLLWDHVVSTAAGAALIVWISVQAILVGFTNWTEPVVFLIGNVIFYLATELWREGEGPHLGMVDGYEHLPARGRTQV